MLKGSISRLWLLVVLAALLAAVVGAGHADARATNTAPKRLHLTFRRVGKGPPIGISEDRYVLVWQPSQAPITPPTVIDDATQRVFNIPIPGPYCTVIGIGGTDVFFSCGSRWQPDVRAYSFTRQSWDAVPQFSSGCQEGDPTCGAEPRAVGADWIEYDTTPCYHCGGSGGPAFQDISSGRVFAGRPTAHTFVNLSLPQLLQTLCSPLTIPAGGSVVPLGRFALVRPPGKALVKKCGSKRSLLTLGANPEAAAQQRGIVWQHGADRTLQGVRLPSLRRFTITLPRSVYVPYKQHNLNTVVLLLTARTLYVENLRGELWAASARKL